MYKYKLTFKLKGGTVLKVEEVSIPTLHQSTLNDLIQFKINSDSYHGHFETVEYEPILDEYVKGFLIGNILGVMLYHDLEKYTWMSFYSAIYLHLSDEDRARLDNHCVNVKNWLLPKIPVAGVYVCPTSTAVL